MHQMLIKISFLQICCSFLFFKYSHFFGLDFKSQDIFFRGTIMKRATMQPGHLLHELINFRRRRILYYRLNFGFLFSEIMFQHLGLEKQSINNLSLYGCACFDESQSFDPFIIGVEVIWFHWFQRHSTPGECSVKLECPVGEFLNNYICDSNILSLE